MIKSSLVKVNEWFSKKVKAETCFLNLRSLFLEWIVLTEIVYSLKYLCIKLKMETSYVIGNVIAIKTEKIDLVYQNFLFYTIFLILFSSHNHLCCFAFFLSLGYIAFGECYIFFLIKVCNKGNIQLWITVGSSQENICIHKFKHIN